MVDPIIAALKAREFKARLSYMATLGIQGVLGQSVCFILQCPTCLKSKEMKRKRMMNLGFEVYCEDSHKVEMVYVNITGLNVREEEAIWF